MNWSNYQEDIFNEVQNGSGNIAVSAVAGGAKSTTLIEAANRVDGDKLFIAFNKHIVTELSGRLPGTKCSTMHSLGFQAVRQSAQKKITLDDKKMYNICKSLVRDIPVKDSWKLTTLLMQLVGMAKNTLVNIDNIESLNNMVEKYGLSIAIWSKASELEVEQSKLQYALLTCVRSAIKKSNEEFHKNGVIDYNDMIYLPNRFSLPVQESDFVFLDECQDLNQSQLNLALRAAGGRLFSVGDKKQSIYFFSGSLSDSFDRIVEQSDARLMPLNHSFRCPVSHIKLAQEIVPYIEPAPNAKIGEVKEITEDDVSDYVTPGSLIICRKNAPLIALALKLLRKGVQARVRGRDITKQLKDTSKLIDKNYQGDGDTFNARYSKKLSYFFQDKVSELNPETDGDKVEQISDIVSCVKAIIDYGGCKSVDDIHNTLDEIFSDDAAAVWLSSVHKAKGLESHTVFILDYKNIRLSYKGMLPEQQRQESHIEYISLTRSKERLYLVK